MIRERVLRAIALNRTPGYHFAGNFVDLSFDRVASDGTQISFECRDDIGTLAMAADFALGTAIRADLDRRTRTATVSLALDFARSAPPAGTVKASSRCHGFMGEGYGRIGRGHVVLEDASGEIAYGSGVFMVLKPPANVTMHPVPHRKRGDAEPATLSEAELAPEERAILRHADAALEAAQKSGEPFIRHFWGYRAQRTADGASCVMPNGPHVGNRVGNVQGGLLLGLAAVTAAAAVPQRWMLSAISAAFVSPGEGPALQAQSRVVHRGQRLAVVRTEVTKTGGRRVLEAMSTHIALDG